MFKKTLVIGASTNPERYSNKAIKSLRKSNHQVVAIATSNGQVDDVTFDTSLIEYEQLDTVTIYINPKIQTEYEDYIISLKPKRVIFNPGTENFDFAKKLNDHDIETEDACTLVLLASGQY